MDGLKIGQFLAAHPDAGWFLDHFMLDTAGILGKPHKFTGTLIVDGHTFVPYSGYIDRLVAAAGSSDDSVLGPPIAAHKQASRSGASPSSHPLACRHELRMSPRISSIPRELLKLCGGV